MSKKKKEMSYEELMQQIQELKDLLTGALIVYENADKLIKEKKDINRKDESDG